MKIIFTLIGLMSRNYAVEILKILHVSIYDLQMRDMPIADLVKEVAKM